MLKWTKEKTTPSYMKLMTVFFSDWPSKVSIDEFFQFFHRFWYEKYDRLSLYGCSSSSLRIYFFKRLFLLRKKLIFQRKYWFKVKWTNKIDKKKNHSQRLHGNGGKMKTIYLVMLSCTGDEMIVPGKRSKMNNLYSALKFHGNIWNASSVVELTETNGAKAGLAWK